MLHVMARLPGRNREEQGGVHQPLQTPVSVGVGEEDQAMETPSVRQLLGSLVSMAWSTFCAGSLGLSCFVAEYFDVCRCCSAKP
jgi:hypothetical protein